MNINIANDTKCTYFKIKYQKGQIVSQILFQQHHFFYFCIGILTSNSIFYS